MPLRHSINCYDIVVNSVGKISRINACLTNRFQRLFATARLATLILVACSVDWQKHVRIVVSQFICAYVYTGIAKSIDRTYSFRGSLFIQGLAGRVETRKICLLFIGEFITGISLTSNGS